MDWYVPLPASPVTGLAQSLIDVPEQVGRPVAARMELTRRLVGVLADPETAVRVRGSGVRVVVVPRTVTVSEVPGLTDAAHAGLLRTQDGRPVRGVRGVTDPDARLVLVAEENLLGERAKVDVDGESAFYPDGYSSVTHELAHLVWYFGLSEQDRELVREKFEDKLAAGPDTGWADGPRRGTEGAETGNYSSLSAEEFFAQTSTAYLGANHGHDPYTGRARNNGAGWVRTHEDPRMVRLLERLYGADPDPAPGLNPVARTRAEKDLWQGFRDFTASSDAHASIGASPDPGTDTPADTSADTTRQAENPGSTPRQNSANTSDKSAPAEVSSVEPGDAGPSEAGSSESGAAGAADRFYEVAQSEAPLRWGEVELLVGSGARVVITRGGEPMMAVVPVSDLGSGPVTEIGTSELQGGLAAVGDRVAGGERFAVRFRSARVMGVVPVGGLEAAYPSARERTALPNAEAGRWPDSYRAVEVLGSAEVHIEPPRVMTRVGPNKIRGGSGYHVERVLIVADGDGAGLKLDVVREVTVRVYLDVADGISSEELAERQDSARTAVDRLWNRGYRLLGGDLLRVRMEFISDPAKKALAHTVIQLDRHVDRESSRRWGLNTLPDAIAHEFGHNPLDLRDEYREALFQGFRPVYGDNNLMSGVYRSTYEGLQLHDTDFNRMSELEESHPALSVKPRHLLRIAAQSARALGRAGYDTVLPRPVTESAVPSTAAVGPGQGTPPLTATVPLHVREQVLGVHPRTPRLIHHIVPGLTPGTVQTDPVVFLPNGTYRATLEVRDTDGTWSPAPPLESGSAARVFPPLAGDLALPHAPPTTTRMMFPRHWSSEELFYAAARAYEHAVRVSAPSTASAGRGLGVYPLPHRPGWLWRGEYDGVRIEGEVTPDGTLTALRPSTDQDHITAPTLTPAVPMTPREEKRLKRRLPQVSHTLLDRISLGHWTTGRRGFVGFSHQEPGKTPPRIDTIGDPYGHLPNGTHFQPAAFIPLPSADAPHPAPVPRVAEHRMFPEDWDLQDRLEAIDKAYRDSRRRGTLTRDPDNPDVYLFDGIVGTFHPDGTSAPVRIQGAVSIQGAVRDDGARRPVYLDAYPAADQPDPEPDSPGSVAGNRPFDTGTRESASWSHGQLWADAFHHLAAGESQGQDQAEPYPVDESAPPTGGASFNRVEVRTRPVLDAAGRQFGLSFSDAAELTELDLAHEAESGGLGGSSLVESGVGGRWHLSSEHQVSSQRALARLEKLTPKRFEEVVWWARGRISADHQAPVWIESVGGEAAGNSLLNALKVLVAHAYLTQGAEVAAGLSRNLATQYGTQRTRGLVAGVRPVGGVAADVAPGGGPAAWQRTERPVPGVYDARPGLAESATGAKDYAATHQSIPQTSSKEELTRQTALNLKQPSTAVTPAAPLASDDGTGATVVPSSETSGTPLGDEAFPFPPGASWSLGKSVDAHPAIRSIGIPKAELPYKSQLIGSLRSQVEAAGHIVSDQVWEALSQRLLSNYRYLVGDPQAPSGTWGMQVPLGPVEALVSLNPAGPRQVRNPSAAIAGDQAASSLPGDDKFHANQGINAVYAIGAHAQTHSGQTGAMRGGLSATVGVGLPSTVAQVVKVGGGISGTANQSNRTTTRIVDVEAGHVEDDRIDSTLLSYEPNWSFRIRSKRDQHWAQTAEHRLEDPGTERLLLWVPEHYLGKRRPEQVTADDVGDLAKRLPDTYFASGFTGLPKLFDTIVTKLQSEGLDLPIGSTIRDELQQKLWNLDAHLDEAVNDAARGYTFSLHNRHGRPVAAVALHTQRLDAAERVGETSDKAHVENVRTAIDGFSGGHTITNSTTLTPLLASADIDLVPGSELGVAPTVHASATWTNHDGLSAGRNALNVIVPRYTGFTGGYQIGFEHRAKVSVRGRDAAVDTAPVPDRALVRLPEPDAFGHGFPVDRDALKTDPGPLDRVPFTHNAVRGTGRGPEDPDSKPVPAHIAKGKGIGMGLVKVEQQTVDDILGWLRENLTARGFLPPDTEHPFGSRAWWQHGNALDSQLDNDALLRKEVSRRGLESNYDGTHQDGLAFTLHHRRGFAGVDLDVDSARITITARKSEAAPSRFVRSTDEYHTVNLAMGMAIAGMSTGGGKKLAVGFKFRALFEAFRGGTTGIELHRGISASQFVTFLNNRPELLEYPGRVDEVQLTSDYQVKIEYQRSGMQGRIRPGVRDPEPFTLEAQGAQAFVLPLGSEDGPVSEKPTPREVLDQAAVYYLDTTGARKTATATLRDFTGPAGAADQELNTFAGTIAMRAHLKEILYGAYTSDQPFRSRMFRDTFGAADIRGKMGPSQYVGATDDKFVLGVIKLWLAQAGTTHTSSSGFAWTQVDALLGREAGPATLAGGVSASRGWGWSTTDSRVTTGGKELIQLDFNRVYAYRTEVDLTFTSRVEKHGKLVPASMHGERKSLDGRDMIYLLPEPEALHHYAQGTLPVPDHKLADALARWQAAELQLPGTIVAGVLARWTREARSLPETVARHALARTLHKLHDIGALPVLDSEARTKFTEVFGRQLDDPAQRRDELPLPEYLTRKDPSGVLLGHSGVHSLTYNSGKSTFDIVREQIDKAAPGLLASEPELWIGDGGPKRQIGRLQGGVNALQALLAPGRDQAMLEDLISLNGHSFYLVNPVGWLLADIVEARLTIKVEPTPTVRDFYANTGLENYGHAYVSRSTGNSRDGSQSVGVTGTAAGSHPAGNGALSAAEGHHRGTTRSDVGTAEQTVYDWSGHYRASFPITTSFDVKLLKMAGRSLNNLLDDRRLQWSGHAAEHTVTEPGALVLQVPRGLAESRSYQGPALPRAFTALPQLPGDSYITGVLLDDALPAARRLLADMVGPQANSPTVRSSLVSPTLLSRSYLTNHLFEATAPQGHRLADGVFLPGHSSDRATLWWRAELFDMEVLSPVEWTGTGRYAKQQSGTTATSTSDRKMTAGVTPSGNGQLHTDPATTMDGNNPANRLTSAAQASAGTENSRDEQHIKQQGQVYLVRIRVRSRLEAELFHHHLLRDPEPRGTFRSDPITGDVYAELFAGEVEDLRARLEAARAQLDEAPAKARAAADMWPPFDGAPSFDLGPLLADAVKDNWDAFKTYQGLVRHIRAQAGGDRPVVLTIDQAALAQKTYRSVLEWAVRTMRADLAAARTFDPAVKNPRSLLHYEWYREMDPTILPRTLAGTPEEAITSIINEVNRIHALNPDNPTGAPAPLPQGVPVLGLDPVHLARDIAHELNAHLRLDVTRQDGTVDRRLVEPDGQVRSGATHLTLDDFKIGDPKSEFSAGRIRAAGSTEAAAQRRAEVAVVYPKPSPPENATRPTDLNEREARGLRLADSVELHAVEGTGAGKDSLFGDVRSLLDLSLTAPLAPGEQTVQAALSDHGLLRDLARALPSGGWVASPELQSADGSVRGSYRMRAGYLSLAPVRTAADRTLYQARLRVEVEGASSRNVLVRSGRRTKAERELTVWLSLHSTEAAELGLGLPDGAPQPKPGVQHAGLERRLPSGAGTNGAKLSGVDTAVITEKIESEFARNPRLAGFLPRFGAGNETRSVVWGTAERARQRDNYRKITAALSPDNLQSRKDELLNEGILVALKRKDWTATETVVVRIKGVVPGQAVTYRGDTAPEPESAIARDDGSSGSAEVGAHSVFDATIAIEADITSLMRSRVRIPRRSSQPTRVQHIRTLSADPSRVRLTVPIRSATPTPPEPPDGDRFPGAVAGAFDRVKELDGRVVEAWKAYRSAVESVEGDYEDFYPALREPDAQRRREGYEVVARRFVEHEVERARLRDVHARLVGKFQEAKLRAQEWLEWYQRDPADRDGVGKPLPLEPDDGTGSESGYPLADLGVAGTGEGVPGGLAPYDDEGIRRLAAEAESPGGIWPGEVPAQHLALREAVKVHALGEALRAKQREVDEARGAGKQDLARLLGAEAAYLAQARAGAVEAWEGMRAAIREGVSVLEGDAAEHLERGKVVDVRPGEVEALRRELEQQRLAADSEIEALQREQPVRPAYILLPSRAAYAAYAKRAMRFEAARRERAQRVAWIGELEDRLARAVVKQAVADFEGEREHLLQPSVFPPTALAKDLPEAERRALEERELLGKPVVLEAGPWQVPEQDADRQRFDVMEDHRTLTGPDGRTYELIEPEGDGNRFYAAVAAARTRTAALARRPYSEAGRRVPGGNEQADVPLNASEASRTADRVYAAPLPPTARLDPQAVFRWEELEQLPLKLDGNARRELRKEIRRTGGRIPQSVRRDRACEEALLRVQLRAARRWDPATASLAAELTAQVLGITLTLVNENGTYHTFGDATAAPEDTVTLYERGEEFLAARPHPVEAPAETDAASEEPAPRGDYQRSGADTAELDGTAFTLHESLGGEDRLVGTLLSAIRHAAPGALADAGINTSDDFRDWLDRHVTDDDLPEDTTPPPAADRAIPLSLLEAIGLKPTASQRAQSALLGGMLPAADVDLSPVQRLRLLLRDPVSGHAGDGWFDVLPKVAARELGVEVAVVGPDGRMTLHRCPVDARTTPPAPRALLIHDADRLLVGSVSPRPDGPTTQDVPNTEGEAPPPLTVDAFRIGASSRAPRVGFNRPQGPTDEQADQLAAAMGLTGGSAEEKRRQVIDTVRSAWALFGSELPVPDDAALARLAGVWALSGPARERFPHLTAPLAINSYVREVFGLGSEAEVSGVQITAVTDAAAYAVAQGQPLDVDVLRSRAVPPPAYGAAGAAAMASDPMKSISHGAASAWDMLAYKPQDDGTNSLVFLVSELTEGRQVGKADELSKALLPAVAGEPIGGTRIVLRAAARSFRGDPVATVAKVAESLAAPIDLLLLADADGGVRLLRFDDRGRLEDLGLVPRADGSAHGSASDASWSGARKLVGLDRRPRFVVHSSFEVRRFVFRGEPYADLTVKIAFNGDGSERAEAEAKTVLRNLAQGADERYNFALAPSGETMPRHRLPNGDWLHVTVEHVPVGPDADLAVTLVGHDKPMSQRAWWPDATPDELAHELGHQLFLRDENRDNTNPLRTHAPGSLLGDFRQDPPDDLPKAGLRDRHLQLLGAVIDDVDQYVGPENSDEDASDWDAARAAAPAVTLRQTWVDPVSLPSAEEKPGGPEGVDPQLPPTQVRRYLTPAQERQIELDSARRFATLMASDPVDARQLIALFAWRADWVGAEATPLFEAEVELFTGVKAARFLYSAISERRLSVDDHVQESLRRLGYARTFFFDAHQNTNVATPGDAPLHRRDEVQRITNRLRHDLDRGNVEGALALLARLDRGLPSLWAVSDAWAENYHSDLRAVLLSMAPGQEWRVAHILGDPHDEPVSTEQAALWYEEMERLRYHHYRLGTLRVPHDHPEEGCYLRAHVMALKLQQWGAPIGKISAAGGARSLRISTHHALLATNDCPEPVTWNYHIAPTVKVRLPDGSIAVRVIDPALGLGPLTEQEWLEAIGIRTDLPYERHSRALKDVLLLFQLDQMMRPDRWDNDTGYPTGNPIVVLSEAHTSEFPLPTLLFPQTLRATHEQFHLGLDELAAYAREAASRAAIRRIWDIVRDPSALTNPDDRSLWASVAYGWMLREDNVSTYPVLAEVLRRALPRQGPVLPSAPASALETLDLGLPSLDTLLPPGFAPGAASGHSRGPQHRRHGPVA
ncbi:protein-glutamine glutaminase family protein [Streptomyces sp. NBC_01092]|uniref:protein-glutamine glutaminase family protein n=1 Tax=Streptomyces sp. NBC_01092 TaxID=2903748 RepID=UPI0038660EFE|nr:protein-glutamine glutaminase family protein [Streptomyces sp. NBC_01092]